MMTLDLYDVKDALMAYGDNLSVHSLLSQLFI